MDNVVVRRSIDRERVALLTVRAIVIGLAIHTLLWAVRDWSLHDLHLAYLPAAERIVAGEPLYGGDVTPWTAYRYAPWFAYALVPLTFLPESIVSVAWSIVGLAACVAVVWPLRRGTEQQVIGILLGAFLIGITTGGNVQAWLLALVTLVPERWRPWAIGIAASVKVTFLPLALLYVARRDWRSLAVAVGTAAVLWLPVLAYDVAPITFDPGAARTIPAAWWLPTVAVVGLAALAVAWRWPRYGLLAGAVAGVLAAPRLYLYETTLLIVSVQLPNTEGRSGMEPGSRV